MSNELQTEFNDIIHIRCFFGPAHAGARIYPVRNPLTGELPHCVRKVTSTGDIIYNNGDDPSEHYVKITDSVVIKDGSSFDLNNPIQRNKWESIKFSDLIFDSRGKVDNNNNVIAEPTEKVNSSAIFYVERIADEAKKRNTKERERTQAKNFIYGDTAAGLKLKAKILGCFIKTSTREEIEEYMVMIANTTPEKIINMYTGSDMKLHLYFIYAKEYNILQNKGGLYIYGDGNIIGRTEDDCVNYFKNPNNKLVTDRIVKEVNAAVIDSDELSQLESNEETNKENNKPNKK